MPECVACCRRVLRRAHAQSLVEFALIMPIMLLIMLGMVDFGRAYMAGVAIEAAAREGARVAIATAVYDWPSNTQTDTADAAVITAVIARTQASALPVVLSATTDITVCAAIPAPPAAPTVCVAGTTNTLRPISAYTNKAITVTVHTDVQLFTSFLAQYIGFSRACPLSASNKCLSVDSSASMQAW